MKFSSTPKTIGQQVSQTSISKSILPYSIAPNPSVSNPRSGSTKYPTSIVSTTTVVYHD